MTEDPLLHSEEVMENRDGRSKFCEDNPITYNLEKYNVEVHRGLMQEKRELRLIFSPLLAALSFLSSFCHVDIIDTIMTSSTDMLKLT